MWYCMMPLIQTHVSKIPATYSAGPDTYETQVTFSSLIVKYCIC